MSVVFVGTIRRFLSHETESARGRQIGRNRGKEKGRGRVGANCGGGRVGERERE